SLVDGSLDPARDTMGTAGRLTLTLPVALTQALLTRVPAAFHCGIQHVLLTGLALAVTPWCRRPGRGEGGCVAVDAEGTRSAGGRGGGRILISRGRWAGSPAFTRCGWMWAGLMLRRLWGAERRLVGRSSGSRSSCGRCLATGLAMDCCGT